ncbi:MAG TPA: EF-hand domain-containing protein [Bryobacteraceae bacterium]
MFKGRRDALAAALTVVLACAMFGTAVAQKTTVQKAPNSIALGEDEVKQLLLLMDTDKNGKVSKKEFMDFMSAEFDRLDTDKSGELDPKELAQSRIRPSRSAVGK